MCGCGVVKYSLGFGKPVLFSKKINGTIYQVTPWIFGGFCELKGEINSTKAKGAFINLPYRKKLAILSAGCAINVLMGAVLFYLGLQLEIQSIWYFGYLSLALGLSNWIIPIPCLDGGWALWYPILTKIHGIKKGTAIFAKSVKISFVIVIILNILSIPWLVYLIMQGARL
jgi:membrane-associated protease RseP (regulator of RpoE activity)